MSAIKFAITGNNNGLLNSLMQAQRAFSETARVAEKEGGEIDKVFDKIKQSAMTAFAGFGATGNRFYNDAPVRRESQCLDEPTRKNRSNNPL